MEVASPLLKVAQLHKSYGPVPALVDLTWEVRAGEVHALVGENGAGKSTLCRILAGLTPPNSGRITFGGEPYAPPNKREAARRGVRMVMQELNLVANLSIAENIFLEHLPHRWGWISRARLHRDAAAALRRVGLHGIDPARPIRSLGVGRQQLVEIATGLSQHARLLILDEPTAALTDPEIDHLFTRIRELRAQGTAIVYVSHRMDEIRRIADRITILRDGHLIATQPTTDLSLDQIVRLMVGRDLDRDSERQPHPRGPVALTVRGLRSAPAVHDVSFTVHQGEILGFAGLMGSGRTETMRALFGADRPQAGMITLGHPARPVAFRSPRDAVRNGIGFLTENRKEEGLLLPLSIRTNITLASLRRLSGNLGWIQTGAESLAGKRWTQALDVRCQHPDQQVAELSGGNQQKVILARWLCRDTRILIVDEPTRGVDVAAKFEIYRLLDNLAAQGAAILMVSSDLKELMAIADRIAVLSTGRLAATFDRPTWSQDHIMQAALSGYAATSTA